MSLTQSPMQGDLIYDVGMHQGEDTDFYLKKGFRVIGFEADPELVDLPGRWRSRAAVLRHYRIIFILYRIFGDYGPFSRFLLGKVVRRGM